MTAFIIDLPHMIDLALGTPEVGAVNFNVLHALLHILVNHINLNSYKVQLVASENNNFETLLTNFNAPATLSVAEYQFAEDVSKRVLLDRNHKEHANKIAIIEDRFKTGDKIVNVTNLAKEPMALVTSDDLKKLEIKINTISDVLIDAMPENRDILEYSKGNHDKNPFKDMFTVANMSKRLDAVEVTLMKMTELLNNLTKEYLKLEKTVLPFVQLEEVGNIKHTVDTLQHSIRSGEVLGKGGNKSDAKGSGGRGSGKEDATNAKEDAKGGGKGSAQDEAKVSEKEEGKGVGKEDGKGGGKGSGKEGGKGGKGTDTKGSAGKKSGRGSDDDEQAQNKKSKKKLEPVDEDKDEDSQSINASDNEDGDENAEPDSDEDEGEITKPDETDDDEDYEKPTEKAAKGGKDVKASKEGKGGKDGKGGKESKDGKSGKDSKDGKGGKDVKESKDGKDSKGGKDSKDGKGGKGAKDSKDEEDTAKSSKGTKALKDSKRSEGSLVSAYGQPDKDGRVIPDIPTINQFQTSQNAHTASLISFKRGFAEDIEQIKMELNRLTSKICGSAENVLTPDRDGDTKSLDKRLSKNRSSLNVINENLDTNKTLLTNSAIENKFENYDSKFAQIDEDLTDIKLAMELFKKELKNDRIKEMYLQLNNLINEFSKYKDDFCKHLTHTRNLNTKFKEMLEQALKKVEQLSATKVDKTVFEEAIEQKADYSLVQRKVSFNQFAETKEELSNSILEIIGSINEQELSFQEAIDKIYQILDMKFNATDFTDYRESMSDQLGVLKSKVRKIISTKPEAEAAGAKFRVKDLKCVSCDTEVVMKKDQLCPPKSANMRPSTSIRPNLVFDLSNIKTDLVEGRPPSFSKVEPAQPTEVHRKNRYCGGSFTKITQTDMTNKTIFQRCWSAPARNGKAASNLVKGTDGKLYRADPDQVPSAALSTEKTV